MKHTQKLEELRRGYWEGKFSSGSFESYLLSHLSVEELTKLFRVTSLGKTDRFLPEEAWHAFSMMFAHWDAGEYFGRRYSFFGRITSASETDPGWRDFASHYVDPNGRARMEKAITVLADECLRISGEPTSEQRQLVRFVYDFLRQVFLGEGESSPSEQIGQYIERQESATGEEIQQKTGEILSQPDLRRHPLLDLFQKCQKDKNFRQLRETR